MTQAQSTLHHALGLETPFARLDGRRCRYPDVGDRRACVSAGGDIQASVGQMRPERLALRRGRKASYAAACARADEWER